MSEQTAAIQFERSSRSGSTVRGWLHAAAGERERVLVLTHGAGGNANSALLVALAQALAETGVSVLRYDLPFRQARPHGPPSPAMANRDQQGLRDAAATLRETGYQRVFLGGQSYGGRQASMLAASDQAACEGLLLLSYPLHPPGKAGQLRTAHFPDLRVPAFFVQGTKDPFGTVDELDEAMRALEVGHDRIVVEGAGHDLGWSGRKRGAYEDLPGRIAGQFLRFACGEDLG